MAGHLFVFRNAPTSAQSKRLLPITEEQYKAGASGIRKGDLIFRGVCRSDEDNQVTLWLVAKAKTGVIKAANGKYSVRLNFTRLKTAKSSYKLCEGIATGEQLRSVGWKPLDEEEIAACFVDTGVYEQQTKKFKKAIESAVPIPKSFGIKLEDIHKSVLWNASISAPIPVLQKWYDAQIVLNEGRYRDALENRLSELNGYEFEALVEAFFQIKVLGFNFVKATKKSGDGGIDVVLTCRGDAFGEMRMVAQCKCKTAVVGDNDVRRLRVDMNRQKAGRGIFITTSRFSPAAINFANDDGCIHLIDGKSLAALFFRHAEQTPKLWEAIGKVEGQHALLP